MEWRRPLLTLALDARRVVIEMDLKLKAILLFLWCAVTFAGCLNDSTGLEEDQRVWVAIEPIQCLGNSWERDWLAIHDGDYEGYPRDLAGQFEVIKAYYEDLGVKVRAIASRQKYLIVCCACSCHRGDTLYILIRARDVDEMEQEGFRRERPRMPGPITEYD